MDIRQLKTFIVLAKTLSYQKTSDLLNYAPSTLHSHIQALETETGVPLINKTGKKLLLTKEGCTFLPFAERMLSEYETAMDALAINNIPEGSLSIGGCEVNNAYNIVNGISLFAQKHSSVRLTMLASSNASIPSIVKSGTIDVGFYFTLTEQDLPGLQSTFLYQEPVRMFTSRNHPLAERDHLHYPDLNNADFAFPHDDCLFVLEMLDRLKQNYVEIGKTSYLGGVQLVIEQVLKNNAIAIMPLSAIKKLQESTDIVILQLDEPVLWVWETLLYKDVQALKQPAKIFLRHCAAYALDRLRSTGSDELRPPAHMSGHPRNIRMIHSDFS